MLRVFVFMVKDDGEDTAVNKRKGMSVGAEKQHQKIWP